MITHNSAHTNIIYVKGITETVESLDQCIYIYGRSGIIEFIHSTDTCFDSITNNIMDWAIRYVPIRVYSHVQFPY